MARLERGGDDIMDWRYGIGMYTMASLSLVCPLLTLLSRTRTRAAPLKVKHRVFCSTTVVERSSWAQTHFRVRTSQWRKDSSPERKGHKVVNSVSIGTQSLSGMFSIPYRRCLLDGRVRDNDSWRLCAAWSAIISFCLFMLLDVYMLSLILTFESTG